MICGFTGWWFQPLLRSESWSVEAQLRLGWLSIFHGGAMSIDDQRLLKSHKSWGSTRIVLILSHMSIFVAWTFEITLKEVGPPLCTKQQPYFYGSHSNVTSGQIILVHTCSQIRNDHFRGRFIFFLICWRRRLRDVASEVGIICPAM